MKIKKEKNRYLITNFLMPLCSLLLISELTMSDTFADTVRSPSTVPDSPKTFRPSTMGINPPFAIMTRVPNLKCKSYSDAARVLRQKKLKIVKKGYVISNACHRQSNRIISQQPRSGTRLKSGSTISVTLTSSPLTAHISTITTPAKVTKGKSITFRGKVNYKNSRLKWRLDSKTVSNKRNTFTINTRALATGTHTVTLEAYLSHKGLRPQRKIVSRTFTVVAPVTRVTSSIKSDLTVHEAAKAEREKRLRELEKIKEAKLRQQAEAKKQAQIEREKRLQRLREAKNAEKERKRAQREQAIKKAEKARLDAVKKSAKEKREKLKEQQRTEVARRAWEAKQTEITRQQAEQKSVTDRMAKEVEDLWFDSEPSTQPKATESPYIPKSEAATKSEPTDDKIVKEAEEPSLDSLQQTQPSSNEIKKSIDYGEILYNPPTHMTLNKVERIEVRIGRDPVSRQGLIGTGEVQVDKIRVSTSMTVELKGSSFIIDDLNTEPKQIIDPNGFTQWAFDVTPIKSGQHNLNLSASAHYVFSNGERGTKGIPVITRIISIKVDRISEAKSWFFTNWKWIGGFIIVPLLLGYFIYSLNQQKKRRRKITQNFRIFISYRRDDSSGYSLALYEQINPVFGDENVFMDMDDIPHGRDFVEHIEKELSSAHVVLVLIGEHWIDASNNKGRRLDDPDDFVRLEVATALKRDIRVIPVLLKNAKMPSAEELPDDLKKLSRRNAFHIHDDQFDASIEKLITAITDSN